MVSPDTPVWLGPLLSVLGGSFTFVLGMLSDRFKNRNVLVDRTVYENRLSAIKSKVTYLDNWYAKIATFYGQAEADNSPEDMVRLKAMFNELIYMNNFLDKSFLTNEAYDLMIFWDMEMKFYAGWATTMEKVGYKFDTYMDAAGQMSAMLQLTLAVRKELAEIAEEVAAYQKPKKRMSFGDRAKEHDERRQAGEKKRREWREKERLAQKASQAPPELPTATQDAPTGSTRSTQPQEDQNAS